MRGAWTCESAISMGGAGTSIDHQHMMFAHAVSAVAGGLFVAFFFAGLQGLLINVLTSNTLVATVPAGAITGPIRVSNAAGSSTAPGNFTVLP